MFIYKNRKILIAIISFAIAMFLVSGIFVVNSTFFAAAETNATNVEESQ